MRLVLISTVIFFFNCVMFSQEVPNFNTFGNDPKVAAELFVSLNSYSKQLLAKGAPLSFGSHYVLSAERQEFYLLAKSYDSSIEIPITDGTTVNVDLVANLNSITYGKSSYEHKKIYEALLAISYGLESLLKQEPLSLHQEGLNETYQNKDKTVFLLSLVRNLIVIYDRFYSYPVSFQLQVEKEAFLIENPLYALPVNDLFFSADLYKRYSYPSEFPKSLKLQAIKKFEAGALTLGIPLEDISLAMIEGRYNPNFVDVKLVWEALADYEDIRTEDIPESTIKYLKELGPEVMMPNATRPDNMYLDGVLGNLRSQIWGEKYGKFSDLKGVVLNTIFNGKNVLVSIYDLCLRHYIRLNGFQSFKGCIPESDFNSELRYNSIISQMNNCSYEKEKMIQGVLGHMNYEDAFMHFWFKSPDSEFNLYGDYESLRKERYLPSLKMHIIETGILR